jgi:NADH-quinone oxidoreductase subunit M
VLYDRLHTKEIGAFGGVAKVMPTFAVILMFFTMASIGLPGTSGFVGEFLVLLGSYHYAPYLAAILGLGVILGAAYMLLLYKRVMFGETSNPAVQDLQDISSREMVIFAPLIILTFWMGLYPNSFLQYITPAVAHLVSPL